MSTLADLLKGREPAPAAQRMAVELLAAQVTAAAGCRNQRFTSLELIEHEVKRIAGPVAAAKLDGEGAGTIGEAAARRVAELIGLIL